MTYEIDRSMLRTTMRDEACGTLRKEDVGRTITLCGWVARRREHGEHLAFVDLRDTTGIVQCVIDGGVDVRNEWVVKVKGTVRERPEGTVNSDLPTGEVEIGDCEIEVLSQAEPSPFPLNDRIEADENVRLKYRYLDLRRSRMQQNLRTRAKMNSAIRTAAEAMGFVEIETPLLITSTPEGSREFIVPSRLKQGSFYALPQSPQLYKQLSQVGGLDRYYQLARCLRDEDLRADRQFEFTQLDLEASFVTQDDILGFISTIVLHACEAVQGTKIADEIPRITWQDAAERYGSDKPDTRFGMELIELTDVFAETTANVFKADCVKAIVLEGGAELGRARIDALTDLCKQWGAKGLAWAKVVEGRTLEQGISKLLSEKETQLLVERTAAQPGDMVFLVADAREKVRHVLGLLRLELGRPPVTEGGLQFTWVVDFPLFEGVDEETGQPIPAHHPFTMPHLDDIDRMESDPLSVRSQAYDLVCNGWELGSGSIRIYQPEIQERIFRILGISEEEQQKKFGFLLEAFKYGPPPHGGFAFGCDRLAALLAGEENIREVIAFPKTQTGIDPLTNSPSEVDAKQLKELGIAVLPKPK